MAIVMSINSGSSSLKFQLFTMPEEIMIASGMVERIGLPKSIFSVKTHSHEQTETLTIADHKEAIQLVLKALIDFKVVSTLDEIEGIGHRIVHGGEKYSASVIVDEEVENDIENLADLAPLHNPSNLLGIRVIKEILPSAVQTAVFDTAFHQTMDPVSYMYPLPYAYYTKYKIRKYGFHGTSHGYVTRRMRAILGNENASRIISCHLGNGGSLAAVKGGKCINTTMVCNKKSGVLGVSEVSSDMRDIEKAIHQGNMQAKLACDMYVQRISATIASYLVQMGGCDAIIFTAGVGENSIYIRNLIVRSLENALPVELDNEANQIRRVEARISTDASKIQVWVIPTNEELVIAQDTYRLMNVC